MTKLETGELEGITLNVYLYAARKRKPVGPRDVMKGVNLSSPSVAYRHLQKLEDCGYLAKNEFGEYSIKRKAPIKGRVWIGGSLVPKMWLYALLFSSILIVELSIYLIHAAVETYEFQVFFFLLTLITILALAVFTIEGALQIKRKVGGATPE